MAETQLNMIFDGPDVSEGVSVTDLNSALMNIQRAVRFMVEYLAGIEPKSGRPQEWARAQSALNLRAVSSGSFVAELVLQPPSDRQIRLDDYDRNYGGEAIHAILNWQPEQASLPDNVDAQIRDIYEGVSSGIEIAIADAHNRRRVVIPRPASSRQPIVISLEEAIVQGYLMEIDWAKNTARLEPYVGKPAPLVFDDNLAEDMRHLATQFVKIRGKGNLNKNDEWTSIRVETIKGDRHWSQPFDMSDLAKSHKVFRGADSLLIDDPFESDQDLQEFIRIIHKGRDI